jgi:hypothetical protein
LSAFTVFAYNRDMTNETYSFKSVPNHLYCVEYVDDGDCIKFAHSLQDTRTGEYTDIQFSPYAMMSELEFADEVRIIEQAAEIDCLNQGTEFDCYGDNAYDGE